MTQPKLDRERIKRTEEIQTNLDDATDEEHDYVKETYSLIQELFDVTNGWDMSGHSYIDEVCIVRDSLYVNVIWGDGEPDNCSFPASILDADDAVKAARVDYLNKQVIKANADIRMANYTIGTRMEAIVRYQEELVKLTGSANG